jgi:hypothetical protein
MTVYVYKFEGQRPKLFTQAYPFPLARSHR